MITEPIYDLQSRQQVGVSIYGNYSGTPINITLSLLNTEFGGGTERAFHEVKKMQNSGLMPRMGSVARPLNARDLELYHRNAKFGKRYWRWIQLQGQEVREFTGFDSIWGYGYKTEDNTYVLVDKDDKPIFVVKMQNPYTGVEE
jgi:hypothetical protein